MAISGKSHWSTIARRTHRDRVRHMTSQHVPRSLWAWIVATFGSELGTAVLAFAMTWTAAGYGPDTASLVLTLTVAPSVAFGLLGGMLADRFGVRVMMLVSLSGIIMISACMAISIDRSGPSPLLLLAAAALIGTASAFFRPPSGVFPRLFVGDSALGVVMARVGMAGQLARSVGPPLGGALIGVLTLGGVAWLDATTSAVMLLVLVLIRPPRRRRSIDDAPRKEGAVQALRVARSVAGVSALLASVGIIAGAVLPAVILGIPLAARERGWNAGEAGLIEAGWVAGGLICSAWISWRDIASQVWKPMIFGPIIIAAGLEILAFTSLWPVAMSSAALTGAGVVVFTGHAFPTYMLLAPAAMLSRFQSLLIIVQQLPQLVVGPLFGALASSAGTGTPIAAVGLLAVLATLTVARDRKLREIRL
ncbi:MFS transporter [Nocardia carnea]|uniref:MFS transporter n=1 Tax=Nocardia carnea TaxID=37328 RepID=UPI0024577442|nr:MFS transporter [Nocardia carnea]